MIKSIGIVGCGKMGVDIFNYLNDFEYKLTLVCNDSELAASIYKKWDKKKQRALKHRIISQDQFNRLKSQTQIVSDLNSLSKCNLVIECITEDFKLKTSLLKQLEEIIPVNCIVASNTSSFLISSLALDIKHKQNFIGLHFFYPATLKNLVEINTSVYTSKKTVESALSFLKEIDRFNIILEEPNNFLVNKLLLKLQGGVFHLIDRFSISFSEVDALVKEVLFPIGIFEMFDQVGIDVIYTSIENYIKNDPEKIFYKPLLLSLKSQLKQGRLGVKCGEGYYSHSMPIQPKEILHNLDEEIKDQIVKEIFNYYLSTIMAAYDNGILSQKKLEYIMEEYIGPYKSPFVLANELGHIN